MVQVNFWGGVQLLRNGRLLRLNSLQLGIFIQFLNAVEREERIDFLQTRLKSIVLAHYLCNFLALLFHRIGGATIGTFVRLVLKLLDRFFNLLIIEIYLAFSHLAVISLTLIRFLVSFLYLSWLPILIQQDLLHIYRRAFRQSFDLEVISGSFSRFARSVRHFLFLFGSSSHLEHELEVLLQIFRVLLLLHTGLSWRVVRRQDAELHACFCRPLKRYHRWHEERVILLLCSLLICFQALLLVLCLFPIGLVLHLRPLVQLLQLTILLLQHLYLLFFHLFCCRFRHRARLMKSFKIDLLTSLLLRKRL